MSYERLGKRLKELLKTPSALTCIGLDAQARARTIQMLSLSEESHSHDKSRLSPSWSQFKQASLGANTMQTGAM